MHYARMRSHRRSRSRLGFSLVEAAVSVVLVGVIMVVSLQSLGASKRREFDTVDRLLGQQLASALVNEVLLQAYQEPSASTAPPLGVDSGESTGNRSLFDDVDDYSGWTSSPPNDRNGSAIPGTAGWTRSVTVSWADPTTLGSTISINTGLKKITATATKGGKVYGSMTAYRSVGWVDTIPAPTDTTGNTAPVAVATSPDLTKNVGETVSFSGSSSSDPNGDYLSHVWDFGDGTSGTGSSVTHVYSTAGNFICTLTVYDGRGGVGSSAVTAIISP